MKYGHQDEFDKLHGCVIVVVKDDVPHARAFWLNLILVEEIEMMKAAGVPLSQNHDPDHAKPGNKPGLDQRPAFRAIGVGLPATPRC